MSTVTIEPGIPGKLLNPFAINFNRVTKAPEICQPASQPNSRAGVIWFGFEDAGAPRQAGLPFLFLFLVRPGELDDRRIRPEASYPGRSRLPSGGPKQM